jgi:RNA polymerase-binding transcription factor
MPKKQSIKPLKKTTAKKPAVKKTAVIKPLKKTTAKKLAVKKTTVIKPLKKTTAKKPAVQTNLPKTAKKIAKVSLRERKMQDIKKNLIAQKKALLVGALEALSELPGQTVFPDLGDQATAEIERNFMLRLKGRERKLLKKIDEAIERINQKTFGICDKCGLDINIKRLEARPVTTMCIDCKTLQEEEEKLREG